MVTTLASRFQDLQITPSLMAVIQKMGITEPTPIQSSVIPAMLQGRDVVGQARTGSGKTLAFAIPLVSRCDPTLRAVQSLVLVPTRELAIQIAQVMTPLAEAHHIRVTLIYGGRSYEPERRALAVGSHIIIGTPGRTLDHLKQGTLSLNKLRHVVLDESDEMLDRGFGPDVERILSHAPAQRQTALLSATLPDWLMQTASRYLNNPLVFHVDADIDSPPEIEHVVYEMDLAYKFDALRTLLDRQGPHPIIVFGRTKHGVKKLAQKLEGLGYPVAALQGNLSQNARERVMTDFRSGRVRVLLATNVAARGLDIASVEQVINYELPETGELFTHRAGRTGRMGQSGEAITFLTPEDGQKWRQIERTLGRRLARVPWESRPGQQFHEPRRVENEPRPDTAPKRPETAGPAPRRSTTPLAGVPVKGDYRKFRFGQRSGGL